MTIATLHTTPSAVNELNALIVDKKILEGIERFYAPDSTMRESATEFTAGKEANRVRETGFVNGLTAWKATLHDSFVDEARGIAMNRWTLEYTHSQWGTALVNQVAVQTWRDGLIVDEKFYKF